MYGWRARIGHVAPSRGDVLVYEFHRMLPEGFMLLNSTGTIRQLVDADFDKQLQRALRPLPALANYWRRGTPGAGDRQTGGDELPGIYLVWPETGSRQRKDRRLRPADG